MGCTVLDQVPKVCSSQISVRVTDRVRIMDWIRLGLWLV